MMINISKWTNLMWLVSTEIKTATNDSHDQEYGIPSMSDLGHDEAECGPVLFPGGETEGLKRLESMLKKTVNLFLCPLSHSDLQ